MRFTFFQTCFFFQCHQIQKTTFEELNIKEMSFEALGLPSSFEVLEKQEYKSPYPIQKAAIPVIMKGRDVLGIAPTGSGKTASYVLPVLSRLKQRKEAKNRQVDVLVLVPTR